MSNLTDIMSDWNAADEVLNEKIENVGGKTINNIKTLNRVFEDVELHFNEFYSYFTDESSIKVYRNPTTMTCFFTFSGIVKKEISTSASISLGYVKNTATASPYESTRFVMLPASGGAFMLTFQSNKTITATARFANIAVGTSMTFSGCYQGGVKILGVDIDMEEYLRLLNEV